MSGLRPATVLPPLAVGVVVVMVIWPGLMPDVGFWDTGEFQTVLPVLGTAHPTGYPTYVLLGFVANVLLTPLGEPAFRTNVLSLLCVAVAAAATVRLATRLSGRVVIGAATGLGVAFTPYAWKLATHADPHTLHLALVAILFGLLVRWEGARRAAEPGADRWLVISAVVFGLSVGNHSLTLLLGVPVGLYVLAVDPGILIRPWLIATCALALIPTTVAVYLELPLRAGPFPAPQVYGRPNTWDGFWYVALAEQFRGALLDPFGDLPRKLGGLADLATSQFGLVAPLIPLGFLATAVRHPRYALLTGSAMLITVVFNASYINADISRYYLGPVLWAWTWLASLTGVVADQLGAATGVDETGGEATGIEATGVGAPAEGRGLAGAIVPALVPTALALALLVPTASGFALRAEQADLHRDTAARSWLAAALSDFEPDAVIVSTWSASTVLWYAQYVDRLRPDISVVDDRTRLDLDYGEATDVIARFLGRRPVYVIRANTSDLNLVLLQYDLEPVGGGLHPPVFRVIGLRGTGG